MTESSSAQFPTWIFNFWAIWVAHGRKGKFIDYVCYFWASFVSCFNGETSIFNFFILLFCILTKKTALISEFFFKLGNRNGPWVTSLGIIPVISPQPKGIIIPIVSENLQSKVKRKALAMPLGQNDKHSQWFLLKMKALTMPSGQNFALKAQKISLTQY